jgi:hypothetical protein
MCLFIPPSFLGSSGLIQNSYRHEAIGRPFGVGALEIFTHNLKNLTIHDSFIPSGASEGTQGVPAMTVSAGVDWNQAYDAAEAANRTVVGGLSPLGTVGTAGWNLGTGHSLISRSFGLGVDNSLEFTVVLPNASVTTVNEYLTPDLFWAVSPVSSPLALLTQRQFRFVVVGDLPLVSL